MMNSKEAKLAALRDLSITTDALVNGLAAGDLGKGHEAVSVLLMQGMNHFGPKSTAMQQFFPVWDAIKSHIDRGDATQALGQARLWNGQLHEVISIVTNG